MHRHFKIPFFNSEEMEKAVNEFIQTIKTEDTKDFGWSWNRPLANIEENDLEMTIALAAPGLSKSDFKISLEKNLLTVASDKAKIENPNKKVSSEFSYHRFSRTFKLNETIDDTQIKAVYENGILILSLPKKADAKQGPKTIHII